MGAREKVWTLAISDILGNERKGRVVASPRWRDELGSLEEGEDFRIVILEELPEEEPRLSGPVAVCAPFSLTGARLSQMGPAWLVSASPHMQRRARILAPYPLPKGGQHTPSDGVLNLEALAKALVLAWDHRRWWQAAAQSLHAPHPPPSVEPMEVHRQLQALVEKAQASLPPQGPEELAMALARLRSWLKCQGEEEVVKEAAKTFGTAAALAADIYAARALAQSPEEALAVAEARRFLAEAAAPQHELELDRALAREQMSYVVVAVEPHRLSVGKAALEHFRARYRPAYEAHHRRYWSAVGQLRERLLKAGPKAQALRRLDALRELGPPVGAAALARYHALLRYLDPCTEEGAVLPGPMAARCPQCHLELGALPPVQEVEETLGALDQALGEQMARLAKALASVAISQTYDPALDRLLKVVQASQLTTLAQLLDDRLAAFLRCFLVETRIKEAISPLLERLQAGETPSRGEVERAGEEVLRILRSLAEGGHHS